jgi:uncharacterized protein (UPF0335 family)
MALTTYAERVERLHKERDDINTDIREVYAEAKDAGFDTTILREIVRERRMDPEARHSRYALLDAYRQALGMLSDTPLGEAALQRADAEPMPRPRPFAEQPIKRGRGRPKKNPAPLEFGTEAAGVA